MIKEFVKSHKKGLILLLALVIVAAGVRQVRTTNEPSLEETLSETAKLEWKVEQETVIEILTEPESQTEVSSDSKTEETTEPATEIAQEPSIEQPSEIMLETGTVLVGIPDKKPETIPEAKPDTMSEENIPSEEEKESDPEPTDKEEPIRASEAILESETAACTHCWIFESYFQEPDCSNGGLVNQICVHCGETCTVGGMPTENHDFIVENAGDCLSEEIVRCSVCNTREIREKQPENHIDVEDGICYGCGQKVNG